MTEVDTKDQSSKAVKMLALDGDMMKLFRILGLIEVRTWKQEGKN
jgi:hypothetical protein